MKTITIGDKIRHYRKLNNLTQERLAEKINVNKNFIYKLETGQKTVSLHLAIELANVFCISLDELLSDELSHRNFPDYYSLFEDCNYMEKEVLAKILQEIKKVLKNYTIK